MKQLTALLLILALSHPAVAAGPQMPAEGDDSSLDFSLYFTRTRVALEYGGGTPDSTVRQLGVTLREKLGRRLTLGMYAGYVWLTQTGNPLTAGEELDGYHAGFTLHTVLLEGRRASLYAAFDYGYQKVDQKDDDQSVVIDWVQSQAELGAVLALADRWRLYGGGNYGKIDGEERARGGVNHTLDFERGARSGGFIGLDLNVETDGYVGIVYRSGLVRGGEIYFKRRF